MTAVLGPDLGALTANVAAHGVDRASELAEDGWYDLVPSGEWQGWLEGVEACVAMLGPEPEVETGPTLAALSRLRDTIWECLGRAPEHGVGGEVDYWYSAHVRIRALQLRLHELDGSRHG